MRCAGRSSLRTCGPAWGSRTQYRTKYCVFVSSGPTLWERLDCDVMSQQMKRGKHWSNLALHLRISTAAVPLQITISQAEWQDKVRRCCSPRTAHQSAPSMKSGHARTYAHIFGSFNTRPGSPTLSYAPAALVPESWAVAVYSAAFDTDSADSRPWRHIRANARQSKQQ